MAKASKMKAVAPITLDGIFAIRQESLGLTDSSIVERLGLDGESIVALMRQGKLKPAYQLVPALSDLLDVTVVDLIRAMLHDSMRDVLDNVKPIYDSCTITADEVKILAAYKLVKGGDSVTKTIKVPGATVFVVPDEEAGKSSQPAAG